MPFLLFSRRPGEGAVGHHHREAGRPHAKTHTILGCRCACKRTAYSYLLWATGETADILLGEGYANIDSTHNTSIHEYITIVIHAPACSQSFIHETLLFKQPFFLRSPPHPRACRNVGNSSSYRCQRRGSQPAADALGVSRGGGRGGECCREGRHGTGGERGTARC